MTLLDADFARRLARLRLLARRRFVGGAGGARRSTRKGASAEFAEHRSYVAGDDTRRIDWNAYARLEELVLRLFVAEEDLTLYLLVDTSASLGVGDPPKLDAAKRIAAALGYVGLWGGERVSVAPFADSLLKPSPALRGNRRVGTLFRHLEALTPSGETDLNRCVNAFLARSPRPGLVVVISDLLDPGGYKRPLDRLVSEGHEPVLFQVLDRQELQPDLGGDLTLIDSERGTRVEVSVDVHAQRAYTARLDRFLLDIKQYAKRRGIQYVLAPTDQPFEEALMTYLRRAG